VKKVDFNEVYSDRLKQIDKDIKKFTARKAWGMVNLLKIEKKKINECLTKEG